MTRLTLAARAAQPSLKLHVAPAYTDKPLRVLCATDLWARSDYAVQRALSIADAVDVQSLLLHVVDEEESLRLAGRRAEHAHGALHWRVRQRRPLDTPPSISVRIGKPHSTIARVARDWNADLIVLGAYRPRIADWIFGTTAEHLALAVGCTILVVNREPAQGYSDVVLAADSIADATSLAHIAASLKIVHSTQSRYRTILRSRSFASARGEYSGPEQRANAEPHGADSGMTMRALIEAPPELVVTRVGRYPAAMRLFGQSIANTLIRCARSDVLITPRAREQHRTWLPGRISGLRQAT